MNQIVLKPHIFVFIVVWSLATVFLFVVSLVFQGSLAGGLSSSLTVSSDTDLTLAGAGFEAFSGLSELFFSCFLFFFSDSRAFWNFLHDPFMHTPFPRHH